VHLAGTAQARRGLPGQGHLARRPRRDRERRVPGAGRGGRRFHPARAGGTRAVEGMEAKSAVPVCFRNPYGRPFSAVRDFKNLYPTLRDLRASQIVLEYANRGMDDLKLWSEFSRDKELGAGVIDVKAFKAESAADVAERIRAILEHVPPEKL